MGDFAVDMGVMWGIWRGLGGYGGYKGDFGRIWGVLV